MGLTFLLQKGHPGHKSRGIASGTKLATTSLWSPLFWASHRTRAQPRRMAAVWLCEKLQPTKKKTRLSADFLLIEDCLTPWIPELQQLHTSRKSTCSLPRNCATAVKWEHFFSFTARSSTCGSPKRAATNCTGTVGAWHLCMECRHSASF